MKRERRQELKENELAELIGRWIAKIAPYSRAITIGLFAVVVLYGGWMVWANWARGVEQTAWKALYIALDTGGPAELETVAERYPRTEAGNWARLLAADLHLRFGCQEMLTNKANAAQELRKAIDGFLSVRAASGSPFFEERVLWGLARAYEALSGTRQGQGELDNAIQTYQKLAEQFPDGPYATLARQRIAFLSKPENREFYDLFAAYEPPKISTSLPQDLGTSTDLGTGSQAIPQPSPGSSTSESSPSPISGADQRQLPSGDMGNASSPGQSSDASAEEATRDSSPFPPPPSGEPGPAPSSSDSEGNSGGSPDAPQPASEQAPTVGGSSQQS